MEKGVQIEKLKNSLLNNCPTLFLGAGFSRDAICDAGLMPTGKELCSNLISEFVDEKFKKGEISNDEYKEINEYKIRELCSCIDGINGGADPREWFLTNRLKNANANSDLNEYHKKLLSYPWKRIYSVNIDDLVENIYDGSTKRYTSYISKEYIPDKNTEDMILIKLHGDVRKADKGYIFSRDEYNELITQKIDLGLMAFTNELYSTNDIIFIGAALDEPDIEYYLQIYESMQLKSQKNKLFFIEPYPTLALKQKAEKLNAVIINWTTEQFLYFVAELNYKPSDVESARLELNYKMIYRLNDTLKFFKVPYESNIYQGFNCNWQDVFEKWTFDNEMFMNAKMKLDKLLKEESTTKCFSVFGGAFSGKSTLLKQLGVYLYNQDYEVLEYRGKYIDKNAIRKYIQKSSFQKYVIVIDNASFYYNEIEKMFRDNYLKKEVIFLCASRVYYHNKKKYYLDGNCYYEFECKDNITKKDSEVIEKTLKNKRYLSHLLDLPVYQRRKEILRKQSIVNLVIYLTYGKGIKEKLKARFADIQKLSSHESRLLLEVAIFDKADIEYYPIELFNERYGKSVNLSKKIDIRDMKIVDYLKYDDQGLSLRNSLFQDELIKRNQDKAYTILKDLLVYISRYVREGNNDIWVIIFQSLLKEKRLSSQFVFTEKQIGKLLYELKENYEDISYYWLQLGIYEQQKGDYTKALSHLKVAQHIQPQSFKIKHAIARNYLKFANSRESEDMASELFVTGEKLMLELIDSNDYYIRKAKTFSVSCYILEKVRYIQKFDVIVTTRELSQMRDMLDSVYKPGDSYILGAMQDFYKLLISLKKQSLIRMSLSSPYYSIMSKNIQNDENDDVLIESI